MNNNLRNTILLGLFLGVVITGCSNEREGVSVFSARRSTNLASQRYPSTYLNLVRPIAERAFRQYFRVNREKSSANVWISYPAEAQPGQSTERLRDVLTTSPNRRRLMAELQIIQKGSDVLALCRVQSQRLETSARAAFAINRDSDQPDDTPIDRAGATSANPSEEWVNAGRDRKTERLILDAIANQLNKTGR